VFKLEKANIFEELEKITSNYKLYSESHKNYLNVENEFNNLKKDYLHNNKVIKSYSDSLRYIVNNLSTFLKDYLGLYDLLTKYSKNKTVVPHIRELVYENLHKYKGIIDVLNFKDIYNEVTLY
jgi:hypothetical protein